MEFTKKIAEGFVKLLKDKIQVWTKQAAELNAAIILNFNMV